MSDWQKRYEAALARVAGIDRKAAVLSTRVLPTRDIHELDPVLTEGLSGFEKAVLAGDGNLCFGYRVAGSTVTIFTD